MSLLWKISYIDTYERLVESVSPRSALEDWLDGRFDDAGVFGGEHQPEQ